MMTVSTIVRCIYIYVGAVTGIGVAKLVMATGPNFFIKVFS